MKEYLIGAGGWAYFHVSGLKPLTAYARAFNFVEVNSTFYQLPTLEQVEMWRKVVPQDFKFSVRAHRSITHRLKLQPLEETFEAFEKMKQICSILNAEILHLQTPSNLPTETLANNLGTFLASANLQRLRLALEIRGAESSKLPSDLLNVMQNHNMIHSVDLSKEEMPAYEADTLYTRLFGKGKHNIYQPTDGELVEIDDKASKAKSEKVVMSFHFVRMYKDAARLKTYKRTGRFPKITRSTGILSLEEILREDAKFPATKKELVQSQGWKLFDRTETERTHARDLLEKIPERKYNNIGEVVHTLEMMAG